MNNITTDLLIAVALSMDAFSVSICTSTSNLLTKMKMIIFPIIVGVLHFIMPLLGNCLGMLISINLGKIADYILGIIFLILSIELITSKEKENTFKLNYLYLILIALTVSVDSFTVGLGLSLNHQYTLLSSLIFSIISALFTVIGITIGKYLNKRIEKKANLIGSILLFVLSIKYIFKF